MRLRTIDSVINQIFSSEGIFKSIDNAYEESPVQISDLLAARTKEFLPKSEIKSVKAKVFAGILKLDDVNKRAKQIMDKSKSQIVNKGLRRTSSFDASYMSDTGSKHSKSSVLNLGTSQKSDQKLVEVTDQMDKIFLLTLTTFSLDSILDSQKIMKNQKGMQIFYSNGNGRS